MLQRLRNLRAASSDPRDGHDELAKKLFLIVAAVAIALACAAGVIGLRRARAFEAIELKAGDALLRHADHDPTASPPIALVVADERDISEVFGQYPMSDAMMARVLGNLERWGAKVIGMDVYRDVPVATAMPAGTTATRATADDGPARLDALLRSPRNTNIVWAMKLRGGGQGVAPPEALRGRGMARAGDTRPRLSPQIAFTDLPPDAADGTIRHVPLTAVDADDPAQPVASLGLAVAWKYLAVTRAPLPAGARGPIEQGDGRLRLYAATFDALPEDVGPYRRLAGGGFEVPLDYRGPASFPRLPLAAVVDGTLDPALVRGKIVLFGLNAESVRDAFPTPLHPAGEPGTAIHARIADQVLRRQAGGAAPTRYATPRAAEAWVLLWALLGAAAGLAAPSPLRAAAATLLLASALAASAWAGQGRHWWVPVVPPAAAAVAAALLALAFGNARARADRAALMQLFARHVSTDVARTVWRRRGEFFRGGRLRPRKLEATVLFSDLRGFTRFAEQLEPTVLMDYVNEYMTAMARVVTDRGGVVNKFIGDSVMAVFGAFAEDGAPPEQVAADAHRAVDCALAMRGELARLNAAWRDADRGTLQMRVGVQSGHLVAGSLGSAERLEYTVLGDTVNTSSRLESYDKELMDPDIAADGCRILIGQRTRELVGDDYAVRAVGEVTLYGRRAPTRIYGVIGRRVDGDAPPAGRPGDVAAAPSVARPVPLEAASQ